MRRSRGGCWTCRQRRRKCDETKPACNVCQNRNLSCGGYEIRLSEFHAADGHSGQMKCKILRGSSPSGPLSLRSMRQSRQTMAAHPPRTLRAKQDSLKVTPDASAEPSGRQDEASHLDLMNGTTPSNGEIEPSITREAESLPMLDGPVSDENTVSALAVVTSESLPYSEPSHGQLRTWHSLPLDSRSGLDAQDLLGLHLSPPADLSPSALIGFDLDFLGPNNMEIENLRENGSMETINTDQVTHGTHHLDVDVLQDGFALTEEDRPELPTSENANSRASLSAQPTQGPQLDSFDFNSLLLQHFFNVLAPNFCPAHPHHNPYTTVYGTLAFVFRPLRNAVLKAAALHLHHSGQLTLDLSTRFHDHATASAKGAGSTALQGVPKAATIMLSILCEIIGSSSRGWISKLIQARELLAGSNFHDEHAPELQFLRLHFNWMVAISWSMRSSVVPSGEMLQLKFIAEDERPKNRLSRDQVDWFCNLPDYRLSAIFWDATRLSRRLYNEVAQNSHISQQLMPDVADLIHRINIYYPGSSDATSSHSSYSNMVNSGWRNGILCYIYSDICLLPSSDARIQGMSYGLQS
ncbi:hypothetical protein NCS55_01474200 [Fusarium keratoplasticum]|nr:hypothetical protein NCS55_01474200 [Fusarium keratoplasticum]